MSPADIEALVAKWMEWEVPTAKCEQCNPIIRQTSQAEIDAFREAPRELPKLRVAIALKIKQYQHEAE